MSYSNKRVAILAPGSTQGVLGGAERFFDGLLRALLDAGCDGHLLTIPTDESNFESILQAYDHARQLNLHDYDLVISTKAPTFAAAHPNHLLYLVHTIRVFYDMFDEAFPRADDVLRSSANSSSGWIRTRSVESRIGSLSATRFPNGSAIGTAWTPRFCTHR
jgi:hypothetical protein